MGLRMIWVNEVSAWRKKQDASTYKDSGEVWKMWVIRLVEDGSTKPDASYDKDLLE